MNLAVDPEMQKFIEEKLRAGVYSSMEDMVRAGLATLRQQEFFGDFAPGELDALLVEGERSITERGTFDADESLRARRARRATSAADTE